MNTERIARRVVAAFVIGLSIAWAIWAINGFNLSDSAAYRAAADRLVSGSDLYVQTQNQDEAFRYAPWFAVAWIPLNALPRLLGDAVWATVLLTASVIAVLPLARRPELPARLLALLGGSMLIWTAARGNVHPLMMASLVHGIDRRSGPLWIALSASLKAVPVVFVLVYVAERRWKAAVVTAVLTAVLVAPMPLLGWEPSATNPGESLSLWYLASPTVFVAVAVCAMAVAVGVARFRPRWSALAAGTAAVLTLPRLLLYDLTYLLVGAERARAVVVRHGIGHE